MSLRSIQRTPSLRSKQITPLVSTPSPCRRHGSLPLPSLLQWHEQRCHAHGYNNRSIATTHCLAPTAAGDNSRIESDIAPDLILTPPPGGADIVIFGAIHGDPGGRHIGEFILRNRPQSVIVETALNTAHGSETGAVADLESYLQITGNGDAGATDARTLAIARVGAQLSGLPDPLSASLWSDVCSAPFFFSEHIAYVAAFAAGSQLVHGDRPKMITYQRMLWKPSVVDLDVAFGLQSALNYHDLVAQMQPPMMEPSSAKGITEQVLIGERDAVLLQSLHKASLEAGAGQLIVGVVGASHIPGMQRLWKDDGWRSVIENDGVMDLPENIGQGESPETIGVRRALFDGVIRLTCRADVTADIEATLPPPPRESIEAYELTHELYGSSRMLLATLDKEQLEEVCQGWKCDMWEILAPLRAVRPVHGGPGYDTELVLQLRTLNYEIH